MHNCHNGGMLARFGIVGDNIDCCNTGTGGNSGTSTGGSYDDTEIRNLINNKVNVATYTADKKTFALKTELPDTSTLATKDELNAKQDTISVGDGLTLSNNTITLNSPAIKVVDTLPSTLESGVIYLVKSTN